MNYKAQPGISIERSEEIAGKLIAEIHSDPGVEYTYATVGGTNGRSLNQGTIYVRLKNPDARRYYLAIMTDLRARLKRYPALRTAVGTADDWTPRTHGPSRSACAATIWTQV